jgi:putative flippase GtrA
MAPSVIVFPRHCATFTGFWNLGKWTSPCLENQYMMVEFGSAKGTWPFRTNALKIKAFVYKLIRYGISGASATFTHLFLLYLFTDILRIYYLISTSMAFVCAFFVSFMMQKYWTFRNKDNTRVKKQMGLFFFIAITNLCLNALGMKTMVDFIGLNHLISQVMVSLGIAAWSFFAYSYIFKAT